MPDDRSLISARNLGTFLLDIYLAYVIIDSSKLLLNTASHPLAPIVMKFLLTIGFTFGGILTSFAHAQVIPLTIDSTQSSVTISIAGSASSSQLSGNATFELQTSDAQTEITQPTLGQSEISQSEIAQITDLNLVLDEALNFSLFSGFASASTSPSDVAISMVTPGAASTLSASTFTQLANLLVLEGDLDIIDGFGFAGGNQTFDLSGVEIAPSDFNSVSVTRFGSLITISSSVTITENINLGAGDIPLVIDVNYVASGIVPQTTLQGDVNLDGLVDVYDISPFIRVLITGGFQAEADCNQNEVVNFIDIFHFIPLLPAQ